MASYPYRTVVDAAATSRALVDAATVFAELGVTPTGAQTTQMETVILQVSGLFDRFLDRVLAEEEVTDHFSAPAADTLRLSRWPVAEILQVVKDGVELAPGAWELDELTGQLWRIGSGGRTCWSGSGNTLVSYVGGYALPDALPADIQRAAIDQVKAQYMGGARDPNLRSFNAPDLYQASYSVAGGDSSGKSGLMPQVEAVLAPHRRMVV